MRLSNIIRLCLIILIYYFLHFPQNIIAKTLLTDQEALQVMFSENLKVKEEIYTLDPEIKRIVEKKLGFRLNDQYDKEFKFYLGISTNKEIVRYAIIDRVKGKWGPIKYIAGITPEGKVINVAIINYYEQYGKWIKKKKFLNQFIGSYYKSRFITNKKLEAITGATISSKAMIEGVKKILVLFNEFYLKVKKEGTK